MPTWVVPSIAADLWRVSLDHVLARMHEGAVLSKTENGFTFVDIDPSSGSSSSSSRAAPARPLTYRGLTPAELAALHPDAQEQAEECAVATAAEPTPGCEWADIDWRDARRQVQRTRRGPGAAI